MIQLFMAMALAHFPTGNFTSKPVMAEATLLKSLNIPMVAEDKAANVGVAYVNARQVHEISVASHALGRCGGYEDLELGDQKAMVNPLEELQALSRAVAQEEANRYLKRNIKIDYNAEVAEAVKEVNADNLRETVVFLSSYPDRYNRGPSPNKHIEPMMERIAAVMQNYSHPYELRRIRHESTKQDSIGITLYGNQRPEELVILGGHLDSITQSWTNKIAPGADDNASGSANLLEALRIFAANNQQPQRSIEIFWYGGEESGLLGSAEIAKNYRADNMEVISVMQIDMSLVPGAGKGVIGSIADFTTAWLRDLMLQINDHYVGLEVREFNCGYGCSDHASWFRQGFATFAPFEATMNTINRRIHTSDDVIDDRSDFLHSANFSKIALAYLMHMGNSDIRGF
tara:strand:+ start:28838 stop:30040 length:1203 start_codon:yes stop_codon:yes gene_type:complete